MKERRGSNRDQVHEILGTVKKGGNSHYQKLRQALSDTRQQHVVDKCLPENPHNEPVYQAGKLQILYYFLIISSTMIFYQ